VDAVTHTATALQKMGLTALTPGSSLPHTPPSTALIQPSATPHREPEWGTDWWKKPEGSCMFFLRMSYT